MEAHGGYLCRGEDFDPVKLATLAARALLLEGQTHAEDAGLLVSRLPYGKVLRIAYDAPFTYGRRGARWYEEHHALCRLLSVERDFVVHAYVFDPDEFEEVASYAKGRKVGGERLSYADFEPDEDADDDEAFERAKERWPLGHLARVFGVSREDLLRIPRASTVLVALDPEESGLRAETRAG